MGGLNELFEAARAVRERAHAPYSRFKVGAAIRARSGRIHAGCNVENAAYPVGACAEGGAISAMVAGGDVAIAEILVLGWNDANPDAPGLTTPCGGCRQRIREFAAPSTPVHVAGPEGIRRSFTLEELLPASFGPENLEG
ncbi:cytidine deaminase [Labrys wisconsinensis]|uniref:Cytidine deaminase n=1 Tax=Labrys wisconsinensis TaxID=425677 RepID=A0ABU0JDQ0_9HYPH|nr:cytidine deaminase [Labrys wisconsinensis]MDQ0472407.1 cytidine deaminase [Labrys wisconsinensis]